MWWFVPQKDENLTEEQKQKTIRRARLCGLASLLLFVPVAAIAVYSAATGLASFSPPQKIAAVSATVLLFCVCVGLCGYSYVKLKKVVGYKKPPERKNPKDGSDVPRP